MKKWEKIINKAFNQKLQFEEEGLYEKGSGTYWFSRLLESSGVKLCFGGHKHTYAITYPVRENYKYTIEYNKATGSYDTVDKSSLLDGPMNMGPTLENEKGNINWIWKPNNLRRYCPGQDQYT